MVKHINTQKGKGNNIDQSYKDNCGNVYNITNNYYFSPEIAKQDKFFEKTAVSEKNLKFKKKLSFDEKPTNFNNIPDDIIKNVSFYLAPVINEATKNRDVDVMAILNNTKCMFEKGKHYYDKDYWVQHCAASFREILMFVKSLHFNNAYKNIPDLSNPEVEEIFGFLVKSTTYLSSVVHHRLSQLKGDADKLYQSGDYGKMSKEEFAGIQSDFLEFLCIDVVYKLNEIFDNYCKTKK